MAVLTAALLLSVAFLPGPAAAERSQRRSQVLAQPPSRPPLQTVERRIGMMGMQLAIEVEAADRAAALGASEAAVRALEATESRLSTWRPDSELERLNRTPVGVPLSLSPRLTAELAAARRWWRETGGAFEPAIGALVAAWGLRSGGRLPTPEERRAALAGGGLDGLRLAAGAATRTRAGLRIEEAAWGKGAGLDAALEALAADGRAHAALLDLGGHVAVYGRPQDRDRGRPHDHDQTWPLVIPDPRDRARPVLELTIDAGSVSTSGNAVNGFTIAGRRYGHVLDPRTGEPAPDFGSLTVWASQGAASGLAADALATGLYVLGPPAALRWAAEHREEERIEVIVLEATPGVRGGLRARATRGLRGRLRALAGGPAIEWSGSEGERAAVRRSGSGPS